MNFTVPEDQSLGRPGSHLPLLVRCLLETASNGGAVLELGVGYDSTLLLHELCTYRRLLSCEDSEYWHKVFMGLQSPNHEFQLVNDWRSWHTEEQWDVALIDHGSMDLRGPTLMALKGRAKLIVCHDTDDDCYNYDFSSFKYRFDHYICRPQATLVSDDIDISTWSFPTAFGVHK